MVAENFEAEMAQSIKGLRINYQPRLCVTLSPNSNDGTEFDRLVEEKQVASL
ncbi:hypothetical protein OZ401_004770 (plasmid) [Candidatus Chlorohelix allophototropha]|uniref:Uncharacterized protein n=1 Tax=Candidatus Chlorohelix allophototropha TaxID=3003348 RepID=A0ABY9BAL8_9CHLR|nr:hypothetical protein OZ401_004770 [Chloroflexota bacterium L227-S17]